MSVLSIRGRARRHCDSKFIYVLKSAQVEVGGTDAEQRANTAHWPRWCLLAWLGRKL